MAERDLKLLGTKLSPFSHRIEWALKLKGIEYDFVAEDLKNKSSLLLHLNPVYKKVPTLLHRGKPVSESRIILEYIEDIWPHNPIFPQDPLQKAYMRFWAKYVDDKLFDALRMACYKSGDDQTNGVCLVVEVLQILEKEKERTKGNKFFGGEAIGYLDIVFGWIGYWLRYATEAAQLDLLNSDQYPELVLWINEFLQVPIVQEVIPTPSEMRRICNNNN
ncbi:glutathione transferase GST 23-like [Impatiens glandulifera]|uniref:glutathione transferase GST 23-like n=1 Tax=Impatiens glandulifera TaxID=253017 RepID=UPI001FB168E5|nr:glutathione transferase GST 23-like [Impatiens glandulifera]